MVMLSPCEEIERYQSICVLSSEMLDAAKLNEWSQLAALEATVATLRDELSAGGDSSSAMSASDIELKRELIQRILADAAEIRRHADPWLEHVRQFLDAQSVSGTQHRAIASSSNKEQ